MSYLVNAVPAAFIPENGGRFTFRPLDPDQARVLFLTGHWGSPMTSSVGHADTAALISSILGVEVEAQRVSAPAPIPGGPAYLLAAYRGPRLPEGSTTLPAGASLDFFAFSVEGL